MNTDYKFYAIQFLVSYVNTTSDNYTVRVDTYLPILKA